MALANAMLSPSSIRRFEQYAPGHHAQFQRKMLDVAPILLSTTARRHWWRNIKSGRKRDTVVTFHGCGSTRFLG
jgi:hypothetical protein